MGPIAAVGSVLSQYFSAKGRASRSEYWWFHAFNFATLMLCICIDVSLFDPEVGFGSVWNSASFIFYMLMIIPNFTSSIRRLHDTGRSGFWLFIPMVPFVGGLWLLVLMCLPSDADQNVFGTPFGMRPRLKGGDLSDPFMAPARKAAPKQGLFSKGPPPMSIQEQQAKRRAEVLEYYNRRVLNKGGTPA